MNEIEKMYENAGVKKEVIPCPAKYYGYDCTRNNWDDEDCSCDIEGYPPFTTNKQIKLIKWLVDTDNYIKEICRMIDTRRYYIETLYKNISMANNFEEALAGLINNLWQDLTEEDKQQVKGILE